MEDYASAGGWQLLQFLDLFRSGGGFVGLALMLVLVVLSLTTRWGRWVVLTMILFAAPLQVDIAHYTQNVLFTPVQQFRSFAEPFCVVMLAALAFLSFDRSTPPGGLVRRGFPAGGTMFFVYEIVFAIMALISGQISRGLLEPVVYLLLLAGLGVGVGRKLRKPADAYVVVRCMAWAGVFFVAATAIQLLVNRGAITFGGRLYAVTGNPQAAGLVISVNLLPLCVLMLRRDEPTLLRAVFGATAGLLLVFLVWTGSRTGGVIAVTGMVLLFRARVKKLLGAGLILAMVVFAGVQFFEGSINNLERFTSTTNTRVANWAEAIQEFAAHPLTGFMASDRPGITESSYLATAARLGLIGLIPLAVSMGLLMVEVLKLRRLRRLLGKDEMLADLVLAGLGSMAVGALFEGFLLGVLTHQIFMIYLYIVLLGFLLDLVAVAESADGAVMDDSSAEEGWPTPESEAGYESGYGAGFARSSRADPSRLLR